MTLVLGDFGADGPWCWGTLVILVLGDLGAGGLSVGGS